MANRDTILQNLAFALCVLFGVALIANTQAAGDGGWIWYAIFFREGKRLYADMHLALQPLFVLETAAFMALLGKSWLATKVPAVLHLFAYCLGLLLLVRKTRLSDGQKAVLLGAAFFISICFEAYRFDDYHVLADCFEIYSLVLLLSLQRSLATHRVLGFAAALGVLSGLSLMTRLNDGAALFFGVAIAIYCLAPSRRLASLLLFAVAAALTSVLVVKLTGDSLHDYAMYSIFHAAGSKGGAGSVLKYPLHLPVNTYRWLNNVFYQCVIAYITAVALSWVFLLRPLATKRRSLDWIKAALGLMVILIPMHAMREAAKDASLVMSFSAIMVLVSYPLGLLIIARFLRWQFAPAQQHRWDRREILFLIPLGQLASSSMSSGGRHLGLYGPLAVMIAVLAISSPIRLQPRWISFLLTVATLVLINAAYFKTMDPYSWHSYYERPLFVDRQWYRHPVYGPMIIDRQLLQFILPVCDSTESAQPELLSLPFSYANYFCSISPWHGYVQTFFDTSSKETIDGLIGELQASPPTWIFYQRQLDNLALHERIFNHGAPLPHRYLDQLIEQKIASGDWREVYTSNFEDRPQWSTEWILVRTR